MRDLFPGYYMPSDEKLTDVFDSQIHDHQPKNANRISLPESKKLLIEIGSH